MSKRQVLAKVDPRIIVCWCKVVGEGGVIDGQNDISVEDVCSDKFILGNTWAMETPSTFVYWIVCSII